MKPFKLQNDELICLSEDAFLFEDCRIAFVYGDSINGYSVDKPILCKELVNIDWTFLYTLLEIENDEVKVIAGETSWGGSGFIGLIEKRTNSIKWILHLCSMNNPTKIKLENNIVHVTTDLNYPKGIDFVIPLRDPLQFKIKNSI